MKYCPSCLSQYTDLTLKFCLQDGTPLSAAPAKQSSIDTVAFALPVTEQNFSRTSNYRVEAADSGQTQENVKIPAVPKRSSRKPLIAAAVMVPLITLAVVGGGAGWVYISSKNTVVKTDDTPDEDGNDVRKLSEPPPAELIKASEKTSSQETPDREAVKSEIANLIETWKDLTEGRNSEKLAAMYGEKVDYLGQLGTTAAEIKAGLQKTFDAYSEIDIEISNLMVAVDAEGTSATALFDKEWSHEAAPKLSEGKAHFKLHLMKDRSAWRIVTEKQLKVYFNQN